MNLRPIGCNCFWPWCIGVRIPLSLSVSIRYLRVCAQATKCVVQLCIRTHGRLKGKKHSTVAAFQTQFDRYVRPLEFQETKTVAVMYEQRNLGARFIITVVFVSLYHVGLRRLQVTQRTV